MNTYFDINSPSVFNKIFDNNYLELYFFAKSIVKDNEAARVIVEESFVKIQMKKIKFSKMADLLSYLYTLIRVGCIVYFRVEKSRTNVEHQVMIYGLEKKAIEAKKLHSKVIQGLYLRINKLPQRIQQVFTLTYLDGYSKAEIAKRLNLSENKIRNANAKAMKSLNIYFAERV